MPLFYPTLRGGNLVEYWARDFDKLAIGALWTQYLEFASGQKVPFSGYYTSGKLQPLSRDAHRLRHRGVPKYSDSPQPSYGAARVDYGDIFTTIFCLVLRTPLPSRYFSVERTWRVPDATIQYTADTMLL